MPEPQNHQDSMSEQPTLQDIRYVRAETQRFESEEERPTFISDYCEHCDLRISRGCRVLVPEVGEIFPSGSPLRREELKFPYYIEHIRTQLGLPAHRTTCSLFS